MQEIPGPEEPAALPAGLDFAKSLRRAELEKRNAPVPCHWPDAQTSALAAGANDPVQPTSASADQVDYGILCINLWNLKSNVQGRWRPRAILEYGGSHSEFDLRRWPILGSGAGSGWGGPATTLRSDMFLVAQSCEAVLHLLLERHTDTTQSPEEGDAVMDLGSIRLGPFLEPCTMTMKACPFKDAAVQIDMTVTFSRDHLPSMAENGAQKKWIRSPHCDLGYLELVEAKDTDAFYLMATIPAEDYRERSASFSLVNPWILPVRFVYRSPGRLHLLSPISSCWHLLGRVQRCRRVTDEETRIYAAQLVCALESLHEMGIVGLLSSENVLLDVFGNIRIVTRRLFTIDQSCDLGHLAYTAPEVLNGDGPSQLTDWWILGCLMWEILTGLSPFYHHETAERDRKILTEELPLPIYLQDVTADILRCLLKKIPTQRLGAHGISEIKRHDFFIGVEWQRLSTRCRKLSPFQPHDAGTIFTNSPSRPLDESASSSSQTSPPRKIRESGGYLHEEYDFGPWSKGPNPERVIGRPRSSSDVFNPALSEALQQVPLSPDQAAAKALEADSERGGSDPEAVMARLKAALKTKQSTEKVACILDGCTTDVLVTVFKAPILLVNNTPISAIAPAILSCDIPITALEWATELGRADLVGLFLDRGADANHTFDETYGPALTRAARERRTHLVDILAPKTSRILALRTLCLAVEQKDIPTITSLLSCGVPCDFEADDHLLPPPLTSRYDWYHGEDSRWAANPLGPAYNLPPIVRATRNGDVAMVRLLLDHGADPNTAYHSMLSPMPGWHATWQEEAMANKGSWSNGFSCGRVVQLAMQLGHREVVDTLLEAGADIRLPHPECPVPGHICPVVPRSMYLRVTAKLCEAARGRDE